MAGAIIYPGEAKHNSVPSRLRNSSDNEKWGMPLILVLLYLFMEYMRPVNPMNIPMIISIVLFAYWLGIKKKIRTPQGTLFMLLLCEIAIMGPFAVNSYSIWMGFRGMAVLLLCICVPLIHVLNTRHKLDVFLYSFIGLHVYLAIYAITHGGAGPGGPVGDENDLALSMTMVVPFTIGLLSVSKGTGMRIVLGTCLALLIVGVVATFSRGGFLALVAVLGYYFAMSPRKKVLVVVAIILVVVGLAWAPDAYWEEISTIQKDATDTEEGTGALRREFWAIAWATYLGNPVFGVGLNNFMWNVADYQTDEQFEKIGRSFAGTVSHSLYFTLLAELGSVGAVIFGLILAYTGGDLREILRRAREAGQTSAVHHEGGVADRGRKEWVAEKAPVLAQASAASLIGYGVAGVFLTVLTYPQVWTLIAVVVSLKQITVRSQMGDEAV